MKQIIAGIVEGLLGGVLLAILVIVLGIEATTSQVVTLAIGVTVIVSITSNVKDLILKGGTVYEWMVYYNQHSIIVKAGKTVELYVNGKMLDKSTSSWSKKIELKAQLDSGEKITAVISPAKFGEAFNTETTLRCELSVDGKALQMAVV